jgi:hypothetical protein
MRFPLWSPGPQIPADTEDSTRTCQNDASLLPPVIRY